MEQAERSLNHSGASSDRIDPPIITNLDAAERVLNAAQRPLHSREIAAEIIGRGISTLSGQTPWKTINARISEDILRHGSCSRFKRTQYGTFGLRAWVDDQEFWVKRRQIRPLDELIRVLPIPPRTRTGACCGIPRTRDDVSEPGKARPRMSPVGRFSC